MMNIILLAAIAMNCILIALLHKEELKRKDKLNKDLLEQVDRLKKSLDRQLAMERRFNDVLKNEKRNK